MCEFPVTERSLTLPKSSWVGSPFPQRKEGKQTEMAMALACTEINCNLLRGATITDSLLLPCTSSSSSSSSSSVPGRVLFCGRGEGGALGFGRAAAAHSNDNSRSCSWRGRGRSRARAQRKSNGGGGGFSLPASQFLSGYMGGSVHGALAGCGHRELSTGLCDKSNRNQFRSEPRRGVVTMVIPFQRGDATQQPPPDLPSYLFKNRIVFLGMTLVPSVTELIMAELLYLQYEDPEKPIYMYINSTGTTKDGEKYGYETEAFAIYDTMRYVKPPIFTLCVGNAWGEAALLLAAGSKGNRAALPSSTIMIKQPIAQFRGQATDIDIARREVRNVKDELVTLYSRHLGHSAEKIEGDIRRPCYFSPEEAVDYGIIDKVLYSEKGQDGSVVADFKRAQLI